MLIMRFHKLIQSKLLWLIFLGIVVTTFVGWGVASTGDRDPALARLQEPVARINGEEVSFLKFDVTRRLLASQSPNAIPQDMMEDLTFNHLAMAAYATSLGIEVDRDFAARQFALNFTNEQGVVDTEALDRFRQAIRGSQLSETDYITFLREQLMIDQLRQAMAGTVLVPDFDVERWAGLQTDEFVVHYAPMGPELLPEGIEATPAQVSAYFAENAERFTLPEERVVRYLSLPIAEALAEVEAPSEEEVQAVYNSQPDRFTRSVEVPPEEEGGEVTTRREPIPFDEVKAELMEELRLQRAQEATREQALALAVRMTARRGRPGASMEVVAADAGLEIQTTEPFSRTSAGSAPANVAAFRQLAFDLEGTELGQRGGPVQADEAFLLLELAEVIPPRVPDLEEVADQAQAAANSDEQRKALALRVEEVAAAVRSAVEGGTGFEEAAQAQELNVLTTDPISLGTLDPRRSMVPNEVLREVTSHGPGDVMGPIQSRFGGFFLASVASRTPQPLAREEALPEVRRMLTEQVQFQGMFSRFQEQIIQPMIEKL